MEIKLIASDMDGTLLDSRKQKPEELVPVLHALREKGVLFVVASGRQYFSLRSDFEEVAEDIVFIAENGSLIMQREEQLFLEAMSAEMVVEILRATKEIEQVYPVVCGASGAYVQSGSPESFITGVRQYYEDTMVVPDLCAACAEMHDACKVAFFDETLAKTRALPQLQAALGDCYQVIHSSDQWVDVMKHGVNKGRAMQMLMQMKGIEPEACMAFGDYLNDIELLEAVGESYAMANAAPEVKRAAKYIAPSNDENGVMRVIRERFSL